MTAYCIRVVKLALGVAAPAEEKQTVWKRIYQIADDAWKAANWVASGQYLNDQMVRRIYARRGIDAKTDKDQVIAVENDFQEYFGTKRQAATERDIKAQFPNLPPCVTNPLNRVVTANYNKEKGDMLMGNRSLRTYRKGMPIQTTKAAVVLSQGDGDHMVTWKLSRNEHIAFTIYYGRDRANFRHTVQQIIDGGLDYSAPSIQVKNKKLYLLLPVKDPKRDADVDAGLSVGVNLGMVHPAYVCLSDGTKDKAIGSRDDFSRVRIQMQERRRRVQASLVSTRGGKGRQKKLKALEHIGKKERNFARQYNHFVSKQVVEFAAKHRAGVIKIEMLEGFGSDHRHAFVLRNWSYFEMQEMIKYKAERIGIKVVHVDPFRVSQTCSQCGYWEEGQIDAAARKMTCRGCGCVMDVDHNAALNDAVSTKIVTKKEDCQFYRLGLQPKGEAA